MRLVLAVLVIAVLAVSPGMCVKYVSTGGIDTNDGSSWALAKRHIQAGINVASSGEAIHVAGGTYTERITMYDGTVLMGGYKGTEPLPDTRDIVLYLTTINGGAVGTTVTVSNVEDASIDGFTIRNGKARYGGGMYIYRSDIDISNNIFTANQATYRGGGIYCAQSPYLVGDEINITDCDFTSNTAKYFGGGVYLTASDPTVDGCLFSANTSQGGAGMTVDYASAPVVFDNTFEGNIATTGGAMAIQWQSPASVLNNIFHANSAKHGAGLYIYYSAPTVANCLLLENTASGYGGGIYVASYSMPVITNNTIVQNTANVGGGIAGLYKSNFDITNCIIALNDANQGAAAYKDATTTPDFEYTCFWDNAPHPYYPVSWDPVPASTNIGVDPLFVNVATDDYHLQNTDPNFSPCVDVGDNTVVGVGWVDLDGLTRIYNLIVDMGCYEWQPAP